MIGTTDRDYSGNPADVRASEEEIDYLIALANAQFARPLIREDVVWSFSGVRPLYDDGATEAKAATRDYVLELDTNGGSAPLLSVFGGKITTYRRLAKRRWQSWLPIFPSARGAWTEGAVLPGGDFPDRDAGPCDFCWRRNTRSCPPPILTGWSGSMARAAAGCWVMRGASRISALILAMACAPRKSAT